MKKILLFSLLIATMGCNTPKAGWLSKDGKGYTVPGEGEVKRLEKNIRWFGEYRGRTDNPKIVPLLGLGLYDSTQSFGMIWIKPKNTEDWQPGDTIGVSNGGRTIVNNSLLRRAIGEFYRKTTN